MTTTPASDLGLLEDYEALRRGVGAFRLARDVLSVQGPEALSYLQGQVSQDVATLGVGASADALLLEPDGKLAALVRILRVGDDAFWLDTDAGFGSAVAARLARFKLRTKVEILPVEMPAVALRGALALSGDDATGPPEGVFQLTVAWNGVVGVDLLGPGAEAAVAPGARWCGEPAVEALRIEAGIPAMGRELDGRTIAAEAGLVERTVSFTKGCYTGQELVARLDARGNRVARRLCGVVPGEDLGADDRAGVPTLIGAEVVAAEGKVVGHLTSAAWCPGIGGPAALGYLHRSVAVPGPVTLVLRSSEGGAGRSVVGEARTLPLVG